MDDKMLQDTAHWQSLKPPLSPNEEEVCIYEDKCRGHGPICLLGMTKELIHICDYMVDLNPTPQKKPVVAAEWAEFNTPADAIIGDGVLNLAGIGLVDELRRKCDRLVCRVFTRRLEGMKYATHFPTKFLGSKEVRETQSGVVIVTWDP